MGCEDEGSAGLTPNDFRRKYDFEIHSFPPFWGNSAEFLDLVRVGEKRSSRQRSENGDAGRCDDHLIRFWIEDS